MYSPSFHSASQETKSCSLKFYLINFPDSADDLSGSDIYQSEPDSDTYSIDSDKNSIDSDDRNQVCLLCLFF